MKQAIVIFVIALALGAGINGLLMGVPTYATKPGVMSVGQTPAAAGMKRSESIMPDMKVIDGYRRVQFMHRVGDGDQDQQTDFPMQAIQ